jgi:hypothetical protein
LEFDDVFIVNFFADSPAEKEFRVLSSYLKELEDMKVCMRTHVYKPTGL